VLLSPKRRKIPVQINGRACADPPPDETAHRGGAKTAPPALKPLVASSGLYRWQDARPQVGLQRRPFSKVLHVEYLELAPTNQAPGKPLAQPNQLTTHPLKPPTLPRVLTALSSRPLYKKECGVERGWGTLGNLYFR
jgi:hypothetical protein